jgi:hypothetical protein
MLSLFFAINESERSNQITKEKSAYETDPARYMILFPVCRTQVILYLELF